jgi:hypothetical protein
MRFAFDDDSNGSDDFDINRDFPLGDGTADMSGTVRCPYCGEENTITLDPGSGETQEYVEDCPVCCQAWRVTVEYDADGTAVVSASALDD